MNVYGNGPSTELDQTALGKIQTGFTPKDIAITNSDKNILQQLATRVAEIAANPAMVETRQLWWKLNNLEKCRPIIFCDPENGWNEIITEAQMKCTGKLARRWEMDLRKEIFWGEEMGDDKPIEPFFDVPYTVAAEDWGVNVESHQTQKNGSTVWTSPIKDYERDLSKLKTPTIEIDWETTNGCLEIAQDIFKNILTVRLKGNWWWSLGVTLPIVTLRGLFNLYTDYYKHPDGLKALLEFISNAHLAKLDYLESHKLLSLNNDGTYVGSGGFGYTSELPQNGHNGYVRTADMWGFTESQETINVSPEMYAEFIHPYEKPIMERFGLTCYGCCEELHTRWHVVKNHPKLRRVSCSPWADYDKMAANLEDRYIFSMKPTPTPLASSSLNVDAIRSDLRNAFEQTKDCVVEVTMKDNHTIGNNPQNVIEWCKIAKEEANRIAGED
jgi:hypothetical protein